MTAPVISTTGNPELTQEQVQKILVLPLLAKSVFLASNPRPFDVTAAGPVRIPKLVGETDPSWTAENEAIDEVDIETDELVLLDGIKSLKTITRYSNELLRSSVIALDSALRDKLVLDVSNKLDRALLAGTGDVDIVTSKPTTPVGVINYAGTQEMTSVGVLSLDDCHDAIGLALGGNANLSSMRWIMRSQIFVHLRKLKDTMDRYQMTPDPTQAGSYLLHGLPVSISNRLPFTLGTGTNETAVVLWDPSQVAVARDLAPSVKILDQTYAANDQIGIRVVAHYDAGPLNPEAIVVLRGITG